MTGDRRPSGPDVGDGATLQQVEHPGSRGLVVLRMHLSSRLPATPAEDLERIAGVARGLEPDELLAVRSHAPLRPGEAGAGLDARDLSALHCTFAPDDHELLVWRPPPEPPSTERPRVADGGTLDLRALPLRGALVVAVAAAAGLRPGEALVLIDARPPLLLVDLLTGRAVLEDVRYTGARVLTRLRRRDQSGPPGESTPAARFATTPSRAHSP